MMVDFFLDPQTNDIELSNSRVRLTTDLTQLTRQRILITLRAFRGEWFRNILFGIPYLENDNNSIQILEKNGQVIADIEVRRAILDTEGVVGLDNYTSSVNKQTRTLTITFIANIVDGSQVSVEELELV